MSFLATNQASWSPLSPLFPPLHAANVQSLALADGVVGNAIVLAEHPVVVEAADLALLRRQIAHQELLERALADEADAGRILLQRDVQAGRRGDPAHLALVQAGQREQRLRQLLLVEAMQEIALVLGAILGLEQLPGTLRTRAPPA
jgi:hypothetical protein